MSLFESLARIYNPSGQEEKMIEFVTQWLRNNDLVQNAKIESDISWGVHYSRTFRIGCDENVLPRGVLLVAHLDSDHLPSSAEDLTRVQFRHDLKTQLVHYDNNTEVGLDDKTGIVVILNTLLALKQQETVYGTQVPVHVVFTTQEEVGQKGVMNLPFEKLQEIHSCTQFGIMVDRMSNRHKGQRHAVTKYRGVPLIVPSQEDILLNLFEKALGAPIPTCESEFCSDALEWRGRIDAEIIAKDLLSKLYNEYDSITSGMLKKLKSLPASQRISGYGAPPRATRYEVMQKIHVALYYGGVKVPNDQAFSVVNLSLDYDDDKYCISMKELDETTQILVRFVEHLSKL